MSTSNHRATGPVEIPTLTAHFAPDAAAEPHVVVGHTPGPSGAVVLILDREAAEVLPRIIARFDDWDTLEDELPDVPDNAASESTWMRVLIDVLAARAMAGEVAPMRLVGTYVPIPSEPVDEDGPLRKALARLRLIGGER